jgi:hypothetical protein
MKFVIWGPLGSKIREQTSCNKKSVPSEQLLFHRGKLMQATVLETKARWRRIPIFNRALFPPWNDFDFDPDFEPILQRRLSIVTDDYVLIADYMESNQEHKYDWLLHPVGFKEIEGVETAESILPKLSDDPNSPYKYFTNAKKYIANEGTKVKFEEGIMRLDVHTIWPKKAEIILAEYPIGGNQSRIRNNPDRATYCVRVEEKEAVFLNLIEPYKDKSVINKIESPSPDQIIVYLKDGRKQIISVGNFNKNDLEIKIDEFFKGEKVGSEYAKINNND